jgi:hypothetical protein
MVNQDAILPDWVNLPSDSEAQSLWVCLHDCEATAIQSNLLTQTVNLEIKAFFLPDDLRVCFQFEEVSSVRINQLQRPYESLLTPEMTWNEKNEVAKQWIDKWREESMDWQKLEAALITDPLNILDAELVKVAEGLTLRLDGYLDGEKYDDVWCKVFIRAKTLNVTRSDDQDFSFEAFFNAGAEWWESFGENKTITEVD